jgi:hypothetical protein
MVYKRQQILVYRGVTRYGPMISIKVISNGVTGFLMLPKGAVDSSFILRRWHKSHSLTESTDFRISVYQELRVSKSQVLSGLGCVNGIMILSYYISN